MAIGRQELGSTGSEDIAECMLPLSLHHDSHPSLGTRAAWGAEVFTQLVMVSVCLSPLKEFCPFTYLCVHEY